MKVYNNTNAKIIGWKRSLASRLKLAFFTKTPFQYDSRLSSMPVAAKSFFGCYFNSQGQTVIIDLYGSQQRLLSSILYWQLSEDPRRDLKAVKKKDVPYSVVVFHEGRRIEHRYQTDGSYVGKEATKGDRTIVSVKGRTAETMVVTSTEGAELCRLGINDQQEIVEVKDLRPDDWFSNVPTLRGTTYGCRVNINSLEEGLALAETIKTPVELALPYDISTYRILSKHLPTLAEAWVRSSLRVQSLHAVQAPITEDSFLTWGEETLSFADLLGAKVVIIHPNRVAREEKEEAQKRTLDYIKRIQEKHQALLVMETFRSGKRVFSWHDLLKSDLLIALDTAHLGFDQSRQLIKEASKRIKVLHLSAVGSYGQHLPVDENCLKILRLIKQAGPPFPQAITLEYLREFESLYDRDLPRLSRD